MKITCLVTELFIKQYVTVRYKPLGFVRYNTDIRAWGSNARGSNTTPSQSSSQKGLNVMVVCVI